MTDDPIRDYQLQSISEHTPDEKYNMTELTEEKITTTPVTTPSKQDDGHDDHHSDHDDHHSDHDDHHIDHHDDKDDNVLTLTVDPEELALLKYIRKSLKIHRKKMREAYDEIDEKVMPKTSPTTTPITVTPTPSTDSSPTDGMSDDIDDDMNDDSTDYSDAGTPFEDETK